MTEIRQESAMEQNYIRKEAENGLSSVKTWNTRYQDSSHYCRWDVGTPRGKLKQLFLGNANMRIKIMILMKARDREPHCSPVICAMVNGFEWNFKGQLSSKDHYE
ncbi:hypothetical protein CBL_03212 [Carabus blaptoides fortunei]